MGAEEAPADTGLLPAFVKSFVMVRRPWCIDFAWQCTRLLLTTECSLLLCSLAACPGEQSNSVCACRLL